MIGAGSAARDAAGKAADEHGAKVALAERTRWGGSCPNVACKPTKAYLVAADLLRDLRAIGPDLGLDGAPDRAELARVRAWKDSLVKPQERWLDDLSDRFDTFPGEAAFADERTVVVDGQELTADRFLVATGSRTAVPDVPGLPDDWVDHVSALELDELPEALLVVGGGPVGLEFAQIFRRFGSEVTIVQSADRIAPRADDDAAAELAKALADEGVRIVTGTRVERFDDGVPVLGTGERLPPQRVLLASGREPNVEELGLERIGVETNRKGIVVDERLRTSVEGIWAAGDVTGLAQFTPVAQYQARIAVDDMFDAADRSADYSLLPTAIFTDPELASIGETERAARERGADVDVVRHPVTSVTRSQYIKEKHGLYKVVFERTTRKVLGVHVLSRNASDIVQGLALALGAGVTVDDLAAAHHIYPSWGEGVKAAAEQAPSPT